MPLSGWVRWYVDTRSIGSMAANSSQGYQMARNLQSKLTSGDKVSIFDINSEAMKGLETEMKAVATGAVVELAASAFDASKDAVSTWCFFRQCFPRCNDDLSLFYVLIHDLSWGQLS